MQMLSLMPSPTQFSAIVKLSPTSGEVTILKLSNTDDARAYEGYLSAPQAIEFPTENGLTAHGVYYPAHNRDYVGPRGERPPLLVKSHGGPTGSTATVLDLEIQYWTSRGIAVLDVCFFRIGNPAGYVVHEPPKNFTTSFLISRFISQCRLSSPRNSSSR